MSFSGHFNATSDISNNYPVNNNRAVDATAHSSSAIVPAGQQQYDNHNRNRNHHYHLYTTPHSSSSSSHNTTPTNAHRQSGVRRGQPNEKRHPHGGAKSHKLLDKASYRNLFVARLPRTLGNDELMAIFAEPQDNLKPQSAVVMMDMATGKSKGFGFVTFATEEDGKLACDVISAKTFPVTPSSFTNETFDIQQPATYTLELKPSTFNGQRIVVESRHVYFRNLPMQLFGSSPAPADPFDQIRALLGQHGAVVHVELHGHSDANPTTGPPLLVSFGSQQQAATAIAACHGKALFPDLTTTPVMAKYADMTTVKVLEKQSRSSGNDSTPTAPVAAGGSSNEILRRRSSGGGSSASPPASLSGNSTPMAIQSSTSGEQLPYPAVGSRVPLGRGYTRSRGSSVLSPTTGGVAATAGGGGGGFTRSPPMVEFYPPPSLVPNRSSFSSNPSSSGRGSSSHSRRGSQRGGSAVTVSYRNDPYNRDGYVVLSSSSSQSSRLSTRSGSSDVGSFEREQQY